MNTEETKILNQNQTKETKVKTQEQKSGNGEKVAYAAGGFVAGVTSGVAGSAYANTPNEEELVVTPESSEEEIVVTTQQTNVEDATAQTAETSPAPEDVLLATDEGVRIAQVNDDASFSQAFAEARAQVGPGGVFEWRGQVYGTYYADEWNNMSAEDRANFQSKIDYQSVTGESAANVNPSTTTTTHAEPVIAANSEMVDEQSTQGGIKVLGVETVVDPQGNQMTIAGVEIADEQALLVDVDNNGVMDVILVDENHDGQVSENEIYDVSDAGIYTADLQNHMVASQNSGVMTAYDDGMPDYMNDADISPMA